MNIMLQLIFQLIITPADCNANMTQSTFVIIEAKTFNEVKKVLEKSKSSDENICKATTTIYSRTHYFYFKQQQNNAQMMKEKLTKNLSKAPIFQQWTVNEA